MERDKDADDNNPFRYCGEYFDKETGTIYLRARYYQPMTGRFMTEEPIRDGLNWYTYCDGKPIKFKDPSGLLMKGDEKYDSGTYKILKDLGDRWNAAKTKSEKDKIHTQANLARKNADNGTPMVYAQDKITNMLVENGKAGVAELNKNILSNKIAVSAHMSNIDPYFISWAWLGAKAYAGTIPFTNINIPEGWNFKFQEEWRVPIEYKTFYTYDFENTKYDYHDMTKGNHRNYEDYMYFEGQYIGADNLGNINLGYVGTKMGIDQYYFKGMFADYIDDDPIDQQMLQLGIELANRY